MFERMRVRWRKMRVPLRFAILVVFLAIFAPLTVGVIGYNYASSRTLAVQVLQQRVTEVSNRIVERQQRFLLPATSLARIYANRFAESNVRALDDPGFAPAVLEAMALFPQLYAVYAAYDNGDFMHIVKFSARELARPEAFHIPSGARFAVRKIVRSRGKEAEVWQYLDEKRRPVGFSRVPVTFDPRSRPWYDAAQHSSVVVASGPYRFAASQQMGITFSAKLAGRWRGAVGVDVTTDDLTDFLTRIRVGGAGHILVFGTGGSLIAATPGFSVAGAEPTGGARTDPTADELLAMFVQLMAKDDQSQMRATFRGVDYLVDLHVFRFTDQSVFRVVVMAPLQELLAPIVRISLWTAVISAAIGLLAVPLILFVSGRVAKPILLLAEDSRHIEQMQMQALPQLNSHVTEVFELAESFNSMKRTLTYVTKYVPSTVVWDLVRSKQEPVPGGSKRTISILFTDVQDFTRLSEGMAPDDLLRKATTYYHEVGKVLIDTGALIGRFMGDGMVAYWNASTDDASHVMHAAEAVLRARSNSEALNRRWESYGWPIMHTRFGLHIGEAIVGNIGLPDRMDYNAFGDSLNLASRLEGLNKFYATQILVSSGVADALRPRFTLRWVDRVTPRGVTVPMEILELVGIETGGDEFIRASPLQVRMTQFWNTEVAVPYLNRQWQKALVAIKEYRKAFPQDGLASIFAVRCQQFRKSPPPKDWDGVVRYTEK